MVQKIHLNIDVDIIRPLFIKLPQMAMLNTLIVIRPCLLRLLIINCSNNVPKHVKKSAI